MRDPGTASGTLTMTRWLDKGGSIPFSSRSRTSFAFFISFYFKRYRDSQYFERVIKKAGIFLVQGPFCDDYQKTIFAFTFCCS